MSSNGNRMHGDLRAQRTKHRLAQALIDLGAERGIDDFDVADLTETAGVGRSTFYAHFANKQDFLARSFVSMLEVMQHHAQRTDPERRALLPARDVFAHVADARAFALQVSQSQEHRAMLDAGEARLRAMAEANLARLKPEMHAERRRETAVYVAAGFIGLLRWWIESGLRQTPERLTAAFEAMTNGILADAEN